MILEQGHVFVFLVYLILKNRWIGVQFSYLVSSENREVIRISRGKFHLLLLGLVAFVERRDEGRPVAEASGDGEGRVETLEDRAEEHQLPDPDIDRQSRQVKAEGSQLETGVILK